MICAAISPYEATRSQVGTMVGEECFTFVHVNALLEVCEQCHSKGLYARARRSEVEGVTGIDDPYEEPAGPDVVLETVDCPAQESARRIVEYLARCGFLWDEVGLSCALRRLGGGWRLQVLIVQKGY